jgi:hypothetical protein
MTADDRVIRDHQSRGQTQPESGNGEPATSLSHQEYGSLCIRRRHPCLLQAYSAGMRAVIAAVLLLLLQGAAGAPTYSVTRWTGDHGFLFEFRSAATAVLVPPADNALSARQKLPFPWKFFGQSVDGYFISDNGYITFDAGAKTSVSTSTALPHAAAPANSIFALWTDLRLDAGRGQWVGHVYSATLGAAPNRVHAVYWMGPVPAGDTFDRSSFNFLLALYENGEFEVIFTSGRKNLPVSATVGALSPDGKVAVVAAGPGFDYPPVGFGGDDDLNFQFKPAEK